MLALCLRRCHLSPEPRRDHAGLWGMHARADPRLDVHRLLPCVIAVRGAARQHRYYSPASGSAANPCTGRSRRTASASHSTSSSRWAARPPPPPSSTRPLPLDGDINAELSYPQNARPQDVVVELRHRASDHPERVADTGRQPSEVLSSWQPDAVSSHGRHPTESPYIICRYILMHALHQICESLGLRPPS